MSAQQLKIGFIQLFKAIFSCQSARKTSMSFFSCTLFCPSGQNVPDINKCVAQIPGFKKNLRTPNAIRGNNRHTTVIEDTLIIVHFLPSYSGKLKNSMQI